MVGLVLVSHSRPLALAVQELVRSMTGSTLSLAIAAGVGDHHAELGTDAVEIMEAILAVQSSEGVLVLMDMGSAILSAETALDLMDEAARANVRFCAAPFLEGAVAAGVTANLGSDLSQVYQEAMAALLPKQKALGPKEDAPLEPKPAAPAAPVSGATPPLTLRLTIKNVHGLHARPAALLIRETAPFHSLLTLCNLTNQRGPVSLKSLSSVASLEILRDHEIEIAATGEDASSALDKIKQLVQSGLGETLPSAASGPAPSVPPTPPAPAAGNRPTSVSEGVAIGPLFTFQDTAFAISSEKASDIPAEILRLENAVTAARVSLERQRAQITASVGAAQGEIFGAQILALQDPDLVDHARHLITAEKQNAAAAWAEANRLIVSRYAALADPYLRERAADVEDVGRQVLEELGVKKETALEIPTPSILVARDLTPNQVSTLPRDLVLGVILLEGGATAHSSILLKALGLPTLVQAKSAFALCPVSDAAVVAFDGATGEIWFDPPPPLLAELRRRQSDQGRRAFAEKKASAEPGATRDGSRVQIFANVGHVAEAAAVISAGAEGIGLLRTEFLFLDRETAPDEDEQMAALRQVSQDLGDRPLIVRTLDIGGDKEVSYLHLPVEANPFLGVRALRLCFADQALFTTQLRAILRAGEGRNFKIMFPMVADVSDLARACAILEQVHRDLQQAGVPHTWPLEIGIMIEIPSAALQAAALAEQVDFFSIGTNDLTQYTLAADRGNPVLASYQDPVHPAVLRLVQEVVRGAEKHHRLVAVCGEAAGDELAAALLVGLGVEELSVSAVRIPRLKAFLRHHTLPELQKLATRALACQTAPEVRSLAQDLSWPSS
jgi:phosphoenolpyruvate-protein phosphotransferase/dihydroxyacetone kinase phosphotransfer subunit